MYNITHKIEDTIYPLPGISRSVPILVFTRLCLSSNLSFNFYGASLWLKLYLSHSLKPPLLPRLRRKAPLLTVWASLLAAKALSPLPPPLPKCLRLIDRHSRLHPAAAAAEMPDRKISNPRLQHPPPLPKICSKKVWTNSCCSINLKRKFIILEVKVSISNAKLSNFLQPWKRWKGRLRLYAVHRFWLVNEAEFLPRSSTLPSSPPFAPFPVSTRWRFSHSLKCA